MNMISGLKCVLRTENVCIKLSNLDSIVSLKCAFTLIYNNEKKVIMIWRTV